MKNYFYSKFDNTNWSWWKPESIPIEMKSVLENINRQLKSYFPSNILIYYPTKENYTLISERFQIDRDNAGRAFSFRNYLIAEKSEIKKKAEWLDFLEQFNNPVDYRFPENIDLPLVINASQRDKKQKLLFEILFEHCISGNKICIKDDDISEVSRKPAKEINSLNFNNFPNGKLFLETLGLLPFSIFKQVPFCFNYENEFINLTDDKLNFVNIIFCGNKSIVADTFHLDEKINFDSLIRQGFDVKDVSSLDTNSLKWGLLYDFLTEENYKELVQVLYTVYEKLSQRLGNKSTQELTSDYLRIYMLLNPDVNEISSIDFIQKLIETEGITNETRKILLQAHLRKIDYPYIINNLNQLDKLCKKFGLTEDFERKFSDSNSELLLSNADISSAINNSYLTELSKPVKSALFENITSTPLKVTDLLDENYFTAYNKAIKSVKKAVNFDYLWKQLDMAGIDFTNKSNYRAIQNLFSLTSNEKEYQNFLETQYRITSDNFWLTEIGKNKFQIRLVGSIISLEESLSIWNKINNNSSQVFEIKSVKELYGSLVKFIQSYTDIVSLSDFAQKNAYALQGSQQSFVPLSKVIEGRLQELLYQLLISDNNYFTAICDRISTSELSKKAFHTFLYNSQIFYSQKVDSKSGIVRVLKLLDVIEAKDSDKVQWLTSILNRLPLNEETDFGNQENFEAEEFKKVITKIKGWKQIDSIVIDKLKTGTRLKTTLRRIGRKRFIIISSVTAIVILFIWFLVNHFSEETSIAITPDVKLVEQKDSANNINAPMDSNKVVIEQAEQLINNSFFINSLDTLNFNQFLEKRKTISFLTFSFDYSNFSVYRVKKIDTIKGNIPWNAFVKKYNDSTVKSIELQTAHTASDSFSRVYKIKILPK